MVTHKQWEETNIPPLRMSDRYFPGNGSSIFELKNRAVSSGKTRPKTDKVPKVEEEKMSVRREWLRRVWIAWIRVHV